MAFIWGMMVWFLSFDFCICWILFFGASLPLPALWYLILIFLRLLLSVAMKKNWIKEYFTFSQKELRAVLVLAVLVVFFAFLPTLFPYLVKQNNKLLVDTATQNKLASLEIIETKKEQTTDESTADLYEPKKNSYTFKNNEAETKGRLFYFDPNTATAAQWKQLGLRDKTIQTILNYRNKGGAFKKPEDISRIYGLWPKDFERLKPYIQIANTTKPAETKTFPTPVTSTEIKTKTADYKPKPIDINTADTSAWKSLKGIGPAYAKRIVNFRTKLGGFATVDQVAETFGLPDSTFQSIKPFLVLGTNEVLKININSATIDELKMHPYIKFAAANAIVQYRSQHGEFKSVDDLQKIGAIDLSLFKKMAPYLVIK